MSNKENIDKRKGGLFPPVCVIMATYNGEKYLREQIDSIITQTYKNWVLYVSDDGSTDNTIRILKEYQKKLGKDKIIIAKNNRRKHGAKYNFCFAIDNAPDADFYFFSDQDDVWKEDKIEILLRENMKMNGPAMTHCDSEIVDGNLKRITNITLSEQVTKIPKKQPLARCLFANRVAGHNMCMNKELFSAVKGLDADKIYMHDFYALSFGKVKFIDRVLSSYRQHDGNVLGAGMNYTGTSLIQKIKKFFDKKYHEKWHRETKEYLDQAKQLLEKNPDKENPIVEKFIKISNYRSKVHKFISYFINGYRTDEDWWVLIERTF